MLGPGSTSSNTRASSTVPHHRQPVNTQTKILDTIQGRILCIADIRGHLSLLNKLASDANAKAIIHTGDFGFCGTSPRFKLAAFLPFIGKGRLVLVRVTKADMFLLCL